MRDKIFRKIEEIEEDGLLDDAVDIIEALMKQNSIETFKISVDDMFDSPGYDVYSISVAWIENGQLELVASPVGLG